LSFRNLSALICFRQGSPENFDFGPNFRYAKLYDRGRDAAQEDLG
jgi:hypothetical protein